MPYNSDYIKFSNRQSKMYGQKADKWLLGDRYREGQEKWRLQRDMKKNLRFMDIFIIFILDLALEMNALIGPTDILIRPLV